MSVSNKLLNRVAQRSQRQWEMIADKIPSSKRAGNYGDAEGMKQHLDQNVIRDYEFTNTVLVRNKEDLEDLVYVAFVWFGHGHQSVHTVGIGDSDIGATEEAYETARLEKV